MFATVVVTEGAVTAVAERFAWPALALTGLAVSTPVKAAIPPDAPYDTENVHMYEAGSVAPATFT